MIPQHLYRLEPQMRERVWGGQRLHPHTPPIGEMWCACEQSRVASGAAVGRTVADLAASDGAAFAGTVVASRFPGRFPLLIKLLDCADWLSVQVHPNDEQAQRLEGAGQFGKTEAWHFIDVDPGANAWVRMTLTAPACPSAQTIPVEVERRVREVSGINDVRVEIVWDPPWTKDRMSETAKLALGLY